VFYAKVKVESSREETPNFFSSKRALGQFYEEKRGPEKRVNGDIATGRESASPQPLLRGLRLFRDTNKAIGRTSPI